MREKQLWERAYLLEEGGRQGKKKKTKAQDNMYYLIEMVKV